ncbi:MAG: ABC-type transport auxiliary lipoprotein family protein, partial [Caulobacteraceae bacterium]
RWAAPAAELFEEAVEQGFDATGGAVRLAGRGVGGVQARRLRLDVIRFEARYQPGQAAPLVVVRLHAELEGATAAAEPSAKLFEAEIPAGADRVGDIVAAYDAATTKVVGELVAWVEASGSTRPPAQR